MSTNFYMITQNKELIEYWAPNTYFLTDTPIFGYKIIVAKISVGYFPLFQAHDYHIRSIWEYKEIYDSGEVIIVDEYGRQYTWEEFDRTVLQYRGGKNIELSGIKPRSNLSDIPIFVDENGYEFSTTVLE